MKRLLFARIFSSVLTLLFATSPSFSQDGLRFLSISDIHINKNKLAAMQIDPEGYNPQNDMDAGSYQEVMSLIKARAPQGPNTPDFVIYLGDMIGHKIDTNGRADFVKDNAANVFRGLVASFPDVPIINVFGNNDSLQKNYGDFQYDGMSPFTIATENGFKNGFLSTGVTCRDDGSAHEFPCLDQESPEFGYFSVQIRPKLSVVGLNSVMFSPLHMSNDTAIMSQLAFLSDELQAAQKKGRSVLIAMHIPVGKNVFDGSHFWKSVHEDSFLELVSHYKGLIKGVLVGHTHMEEFTIIRTEGMNIGQYFTAGLSTSHGNSPSVKMFDMAKNNETWTISDYTVYQMHRAEDKKLTFGPYYTFSSTYCSHLDTNDINRCLSRIQFQDTQSRFTVGNPNNPSYPAADPSGFYVNGAPSEETSFTRHLKEWVFQSYAWLSAHGVLS